MTVFDVFFIGVGLSMDAFAISICKGLAMKRFQSGKALVCGLWFGGFQFLMPVLGYLLGSTVSGYITRFSGIVAFVLLSIIGGKMIKESGEMECPSSGADVSFRTMLALAVATSIDALAVGVSFAGYQMNVPKASLLIGCTTFTIAVIGVKVGTVFGDRFEQKSALLGGMILILIGLKLLLNI